MKQIYRLLLFVMLPIYSMGQELKIETLNIARDDQSASEYQRKDVVDNPCGLLKVKFDEPGAVFEGNVIGSVEYKNGEYWVYMNDGSYMFVMKHPSYLPLQFNFRDFGIKRTKSLTTYVMTLSKPQLTTLLDVSYLPIDAEVWVDGKRIGLSPCLIPTLSAGAHHAEIRMDGYRTDKHDIQIITGQTCYLSGELKLMTDEEKEAHEKDLVGDMYENLRFAEGELIYKWGLDTIKNPQRRLRAVRLAAERNYAAAQCEVGEKYYYGDGVEQDFYEAAKWFRKAAKQENNVAKAWLGDIYYYGRGVNKDYVEARNWYLQAADDNAYAQVKIGILYCLGLGVDVDYAEAKRWFQRAVDEKNYSFAKIWIGYLYYNGNGVPQDYKETLKWYQAAADQGSTDGMIKLGGLYYYGQGVKQSFSQAKKLWVEAGEKGNYEAWNNIGVLYAKGKGFKRDYTEAMKWFRKAADKGYMWANGNIGELYMEGKGVPKDDVEALKWIRPAAEQEMSNALGYLGWMYLNGFGVEKDEREGMRLIQKSVNMGNSYYYMGYAREHGLGIESDREDAIKWYKKAAEQHDEDAQARLKELGIK